MSQGLLQKLPATVTDDTMDRYYPNDAALTKGHLFLFDPSNPICYPTQATSMPNLTQLVNLVAGGPNAQCFTATFMTYTGGKGIKFTEATGQISMGTGYDIGALGNVNFALSVWLTLPSGGEENTNPFSKLLGRYSSTTVPNLQSGLDSGTAGKRPRFTAGTSSSSGTSPKTTDITLGVVHHLMGVFENNTMLFYVDGVAQGSPVALTGPLASPAGQSWLIGTWLKGTVFRWSLENLTISGRTGSTAVADEYAKNVGRYS
ncbi:MAG: LamG-like jellyroll fold domain-containing protein [Dyadobacter sp.]|uniref:LamG-like jellyroll fold domain-containing protein n=1 Tax=Dyadobacter sp. TaxID=1914288 RepID=UPI0032642650